MVCGEGVSVGVEQPGTVGWVEGCGECVTQPSMDKRSWQLASRWGRLLETGREKLEAGRQDLA